ncbi:MAG: hypothetical protein J6C27_05870 [Clostridia bacterium]|nr:hypothetical protein [Clostridia bacterium]
MKKRISIILIIVGVLAILFIPIPTGVYKDGGTRVYAALTYKIVDWNRITGESRYSKTCVYFFPNNFKSIDSLWEMENVDPSFTFVATILEINDGGVIVKPKENSWVLDSSDKISFSTEGLQKIDANVGNTVKITFNGVVMESYPAQIDALRWEIYEDDMTEYSFTAEILEINSDSVLVQPFVEGDGISGVDKVLFSTTNLPELNIKIGSKIKVSYNGQVMYSLPAQINPLSWQLCE